MANNTTSQLGISTPEQNAILKRAYIEQDYIIKQLQQEKADLIEWLEEKEKVYRLNFQGYSMSLIQEVLNKIKGGEK